MMYIIFMLLRALTLRCYSLIMNHLSSICTSLSWNISLYQLFPLTGIIFFFFFPQFSLFIFKVANILETAEHIFLWPAVSAHWPISLWLHVWMYHSFHFTLDVLRVSLCICDHVGFDDSTLPITAHSCRSFPMAFSWCIAFYVLFQGMPHTGYVANMLLE